MKLLSEFFKTIKTNNTVYRSVGGVAVVAALILLLPLLAMQFTDEVVWSLYDFVVAWVLLFSAGLTYKLVAGKMGNIMYRAAVGVAVATALLLIWMNLAVGLIGSEDNSANLMYVGVLAVGIFGTIISRLQPHGMAKTLFAMAFAHVLVAIIALIAGLHLSPNSSVAEILGVNGFFAVLWVASALLFRNAARKQAVHSL